MKALLILPLMTLSVLADKILFLGDSITQNGHYTDLIATAWEQHEPGAHEFINLGLSSETVSGLSEEDHPFPRPHLLPRLSRVLAEVKPDQVYACYGMNCGIYHPLNDKRLRAYKSGIHQLVMHCENAGVHITLITPPPYASAVKPRPYNPELPYGFKNPTPDYNDVLQTYADWLKALGRVKNLPVIDIRPGMTPHLAESYPSEPVHPNQVGHTYMAEAILRALEVPYDFQVEGFSSLLDQTRQNRLTHDVTLLNKIGHDNPSVGRRAEPEAKNPLEGTPFKDGSTFHAKHKLQPTFNRFDENKDGVVNKSDGKGWRHLKAHTGIDSAQITLQDYSQGATLEKAGVTYKNVVYKEASGEQLLLDIYQPKNKTDILSPVYYFTHGGGWVAGNKDIGGNMQKVFNALLTEGITCVSASYRLVRNTAEHPVVMKDCVQDCKDGLRFLKKHEDFLKLDLSRVMTFGNSAGGHLALMLAYTSADSFPGAEELQSYLVSPIGCINWYGPVSFLKGELFVPPTEGWKGNPNRFASRMMPDGKACEYVDAPPKQQKMMERLSPITYLKQDSVPVMTIHGDLDETIPQKHSDLLVAKAHEVGADVTYLPVTNAGHGFNDKTSPSIDEIVEKMCKFAVEHLITE